MRRFLDSTAISSDVALEGKKSAAHAVSISTLHAAKGVPRDGVGRGWCSRLTSTFMAKAAGVTSGAGLEWPVVFVAAVEDGILPHRRALESNTGDLNEERYAVRPPERRRHDGASSPADGDVARWSSGCAPAGCCTSA